MKKILSLFMFVLCIAFNANAQNAIDGTNLTWEIDAEGVLTIAGTGDMIDYTPETAPWYGKTFTSVVIEEGVTSIGDYAFYSSSALKTLTVGPTVEGFGIGAFYECLSLNEVYWEAVIAEIRLEGAAESTLNMSDVFNASGITLYYTAGSDISKWVSDNYSTKILYGKGDDLQWTLNNGTLSVKGAGATDFVYQNDWDGSRTAITSVELSGVNAKVVGSYVYSMDGKALYFSCNKNISKVVIPAGVTSIADKAFYKLSGIVAVEIGEDVTNIGDKAFDDCSNIVSVSVFSKSVPALGTNVFDAMLKQTTKKTTLYVYAGNEYISEYKNKWGSYFYSVEVPLPTKGDISTDDFEGSWAVESGVLTVDGVGMLPDYTTDNVAPWIKHTPSKIVIGEGITKVGNRAFYNMKTVTQVVVGKDVSSIGAYAFYNIAASYEFANNPSIGSYALNKAKSKSLVIEEKNRGSYYSADDLMSGNNSYSSVKVKRNFAANTSGTIILPFSYTNLSPNLKFYKLTAYVESDKMLVFDEVTQLEANTPYAWKTNRTVTELSVTSTSNNINVNRIAGTVSVGDWNMIGVYDETKVTPDETGAASNLWVYSSKGDFYNYSDYVWMDPYRAYFKGKKYNEVFVDEGNSINGYVEERSLSIGFIDKDGTTTIERVTIGNDGAIDFNTQDGVYYDLSGRRVENPTSGIYIVNGKKVLVK